MIGRGYGGNIEGELISLIKCLLTLSLFIICSHESIAQPIEQTFDGIEFVKIEQGIYGFGSSNDQPLRLQNESPKTLNIEHDFWMGKYEVSQAEWVAIMGYNPSTFRALGPDFSAPVETISWYQAQELVAQLNQNAGDHYYRLPTEAEWEYVAKAGSSTIWSFGDGSQALTTYAHYDKTTPQYRGLNTANPWGVYDLYGNVYEWVEDWYQASRSSNLGSCAPNSGTYKVIRGGSHRCHIKWLRSSSRNFSYPNRKAHSIGMRLVRVDQPTLDPYRPDGLCISAEVCTNGQCGETLPGLNIVEFDPNIPAYDRSDWPHWNDIDGDCLNTRHEVLLSESLVEPTRVVGDQCRIDEGLWDDPYTGLTFTVGGDLDVDHMVPLANAHDSGGWSWTIDQRRAYANDQSDADHLIAVQASANRSKGARGPEEWRPPQADYHCDYAKIWIQIKARWGLSATTLEWVALLEMLDTCPNGRPIITNPPEVDESLLPQAPDHPGDIVNCSDFNDYNEAFAWFMQYFNQYGDIANLDADGDGIPCASLPGAP